LREAAGSLTEPMLQDAMARYLRGEDCESPASFFARVLLRQNLPRPDTLAPNRCPECGQPPQCGCLHPEGHGSTFFLVCSLCEAEWRYPRAQCPACGEAAVFYSSERIPHIHTQACDHCRRYLHVIDLSRDPAAIPLLDEVAALALDMWARENGYQKIHLNLIGI
jgi:FdhE protein